jgi:hypothetical protein
MKTHFGFTRTQWVLLIFVTAGVFVLVFHVLPLNVGVENLLVGALISLLANLLIGGYQSNKSSKELAASTDKLTGITLQLDNSMGARFGTLGELADQIALQVLNLEDASRKTLVGFAQIFQWAETMLSKPGLTSVWILTFTPYFGRIHKANREALIGFHKLDDPKIDWDNAYTKRTSDEVAERADALYAKILGFANQQRIKFNLVTLSPDDVREQFFDHLKSKLEWNENGQTVDDLIEETIRIHTRTLTDISHCVDHDTQLSFVRGLPLQMFITHRHVSNGRSGDREDSAGSEEAACLVFFIGSQTPISDIQGFYTKFPSLVALFESVFESIVVENGKSYTPPK